jgi:hypothetical protein
VRNTLFRYAVVFLAIALAGCSGGPKFTGYIPPGGGQPALPNITSLSPDTVVAGAASFTLTVSGFNFAANSTVSLNGNGLATTYVSQEELQASVPAASIATAGTESVSVSTPGLSQSNSMNLTIEAGTNFTLSSLPVQANDMIWDPASQQFYLSVQSTNSSFANSVVALNPATGTFDTTQAVGNGPDRLAISGDDSYLYVGMDGSSSVERLTLPSLSADISIPIGSSATPYYAMNIAVAPGAPQTIAVLRGVANIFPADQGGVVIYDNAVARPTSIPGIDGAPNAEIDTIHWGSTSAQLYGASDDSNYDVYALSVNPTGVQIASTYNGANTPPTGNSTSTPTPQLHFDTTTGYLYSDNGAVINPASGNTVGSFPVAGRMTIDDKLGMAYFLGQTLSQIGGPDYTITAFNLTTLTPQGSIVIPGVAGQPVRLLRWGSNGLAFLTNDRSSSSNQPIPGMGVYLVSGSFVTAP